LSENETGRIEVAVLDKNVYIKPIGYATQTISLGVPDFLEAMFRQGCTGVTFDLKACLGMDSTFLGVIAAAAMSRAHGGERAVVILNADKKLIGELKLVGLLPVVAVKKGACEVPDDIQLSEIDFVHLPSSERERIQRIKRLHEGLVKLNDANKVRFKAFCDMLEEELRQTGSDG